MDATNENGGLMASLNDPTANNPFAASSQNGLAPQGDIARAYAVKRLAKRQAALGRQTPGRVLGPPKTPKPRKAY